MKRLKYYLLTMKPDNETYETMYEGKMCEAGIIPIYHNHATYWDDEIGYEITKSNRLELSKPTIFIHIPFKQLNMENMDIITGDYILRSFIPYMQELNEQNNNRKRTAKENGYYYIYEANHEILNRNVVAERLISQKYYENPSRDTIVPMDGAEDVPAYRCVSVMIQVQLPEGKHKKAIQMLTKDLPNAVKRFIVEFNREGLKQALKLGKKQQSIRMWLKQSEYCAFIANGSILPRKSGSDEPMTGAIPFWASKDDEIEIEGIRGMGFLRGVTVITGGGYSGKSTLLDALSAGIYDHIEGDGREYVITDDSAMKISAEDGRSVRHVNISPFIKWIPGGNPTDFTTDHSSGATSQAANIMEAINWGVKLLMIDEDKSATNFMIQDPVMKTLIGKEPITPFVERVRELYQKLGVSTILVIGGSSEYLQVADQIYMMSDYHISPITEEAKQLQERCAYHMDEDIVKEVTSADFNNRDQVDARCLSTYPEGSSTEVMKVSELGFLILGEEQVDIRMLHDIVSVSQLNAIAFLVRRLINQLNPMERFQTFSSEKIMNDETDSYLICRKEEVERLLIEIEENGLETAYSAFFTECGRWLDMPRKYEILAVLGRMRVDDKGLKTQ